MRILLLTLVFLLAGCAAYEEPAPSPPVQGPKTLQQVQAEQERQEREEQEAADAANDAAVQAAVDAMMSVATQ